MIKSIFRFLNVDETFLPNMEKKYLASVNPFKYKINYLNTLLNNDNCVKSAIKFMIPRHIHRGIANAVRRINVAKIELSSRNHRHLTKIYHQDILKLQNLIQRDLSAWLE